MQETPKSVLSFNISEIQNVGNVGSRESTILENSEKTGRMKIRFTKYWKSWRWDQYLPESMNGNLVVWYQYPPENMKWIFGNLGSIKKS